MQDFKKLQVWQKSHALVLETYAKTAHFPANEQFGLTSQARRASISIAANIAEGSSSGSARDFSRFLKMASASASEMEYFAFLARDLGYLTPADRVRWEERSCEIRRMLVAFTKKLTSNRVETAN